MQSKNSLAPHKTAPLIATPSQFLKNKPPKPIAKEADTELIVEDVRMSETQNE